MADLYKLAKGIEDMVKLLGSYESDEEGWVPVKAIRQVVEHNCDMQDLYLPVHFLDIVESMPTRRMESREPVKPIVDVDTWIFGECGHRLEHQEMVGENVLYSERYEYCPACGRRVLWDETQ